jgi:methylthioribose-1-phosphate isomerase
VTHLGGVAVAPAGIAVRNPAFDVTPAELVTGVITEHGIARPPVGAALEALLRRTRDPAAA